MLQEFQKLKIITMVVMIFAAFFLVFYRAYAETIDSQPEEVAVSASVAPHYNCSPDGNKLHVTTNMQVIINGAL